MIRRLMTIFLALLLAQPVWADGIDLSELSTVARKPLPHKLGQLFGTVPPTNGLWVTWEPWNSIEPKAGQYNWTKIDAKLAAAQAVGTTVQLQVLFYTSDIVGSSYFLTWTPEGLPASYTMAAGGKAAVIPPYDDAIWRAAYYNMVRALATRYDGDPRVTSIVIACGLDGETQWTKDASNAWQSEARKISGLEYRYGQFVYAAMDVYAGAFAQTPLFLNNAPGGNARAERAAYAVARGIGLKHSGMLPDLDSATGYGAQVGSWDMMKKYGGMVPLWWESAYGLGASDTRYFGYYAGLSFYPDAMDVHPEWITQTEPAFRAWLEAHLGTTVEDTPSVWSVLREREYPPVMWSATEGVGGWPGNFEQWLTVKGGDPISRPNVPLNNTDWRARNVRYVQAATGDIHYRFQRESYWMHVDVLNRPGDSFCVAYKTGTGTQSVCVPMSQGVSGAWSAYDVPLPGLIVDTTVELSFTGRAYVHKIEILGGEPTPTPTALATVAATSVPLPTATPTKTATVTPSQTLDCPPPLPIQPTYTRYPTQTPLPTYTPWPTPLPTLTPSPTLTIAELIAELERRLALEYEGLDIRVRLELGIP